MSQKPSSPTPSRFSRFRRRAVFGAFCLAVAGVSAYSTLLLKRAPRSAPGFAQIDRLCEKVVAHERRQWDQAYDRAEKQAEAGRLDDATHTLETLVLKIPPRNRLGHEGLLITKVLKRLGELYMRGNQPERALYAFWRVVDFQPGNSYYLALLGGARLKVGNPHIGRDQLLESLAISSNETEAVEALVAHYLENGKTREALKLYNSYYQVFCMVPSASEHPRQPGIYLLEKGREVALLPFVPKIDGLPHVYSIPVGTAAPLLEGRRIDAVRFQFRRTPASGWMEFHEVTFHSAPDLLKIREPASGNTTTLLGIRDFTGSTTEGASPKGNLFWPRQPFPVVTVPLGPPPVVVEGREIDRLVVRFSIHKVIDYAVQSAVEDTKRKLGLDLEVGVELKQ